MNIFITCLKMSEPTNNPSQYLTTSNEFVKERVLVLTPNKNTESGNNWYNRVYLCYEDVSYKPNDILPIKGFKCYRYNSFENADKVSNKFYKMNNIRHTMIPICKWVPYIFDKYILNWKLRNIYWLGIHTIHQGYNGFSKEK